MHTQFEVISLKKRMSCLNVIFFFQFKPEGVERSDAITRVIVSDKGPESETFNINWPTEEVIENSQRIAVKITGKNNYITFYQ